MGKCIKCLRYNPTSKVAGCVLAKDCKLLAVKHGYTLAVTACPEYLEKEVNKLETVLPQVSKDSESKKVR